MAPSLSSTGPPARLTDAPDQAAHARLRERLLASAVDLLAEGGAGGLTARSVAARAETSAPALYELFGDKSGVVRELYFEGFRMLGDELACGARGG